MNVAEVADRAAKGAFTYQQISELTVDHLPALKAATERLRKVTN
jgi:hypothetical protein